MVEVALALPERMVPPTLKVAPGVLVAMPTKEVLPSITTGARVLDEEALPRVRPPVRPLKESRG